MRDPRSGRVHPIAIAWKKGGGRKVLRGRLSTRPMVVLVQPHRRINPLPLNLHIPRQLQLGRIRTTPLRPEPSRQVSRKSQTVQPHREPVPPRNHKSGRGCGTMNRRSTLVRRRGPAGEAQSFRIHALLYPNTQDICWMNGHLHNSSSINSNRSNSNKDQFHARQRRQRLRRGIRPMELCLRTVVQSPLRRRGPVTALLGLGSPPSRA